MESKASRLVGGCLIRQKKNFGLLFDDFIELYALNFVKNDDKKNILRLLDFLKKRFAAIAVYSSEEWQQKIFIDSEFKRVNKDLYVYSKYALLKCPHSGSCGANNQDKLNKHSSSAGRSL